MVIQKALLVKPRDRLDWDMGDVLAIARSEGKKLFKTHENVRVVWVGDSPYGYVVIIENGCSHPSGCKIGENENG